MLTRVSFGVPLLAVTLVGLIACAPAAPSPTAAPAKPAAQPTTAPAAPKPTEAPAAKPAESKPAEAKPAEAKPAASPAAKAAEKPAEKAPAKPTTMEKLTLRMGWIVVGNNAMYMAGKEKGFFAEEGIDLEVGPGRGSGVTAQVVASKGDPIGQGDVATFATTIAKDAPMTVIASHFQRTPMGVTVLADSPIKTPQDLKGKRVATAAGSSAFVMFPAFMAAVGMKPDDVTIVTVEPAASVAALVEGKADALLDLVVFGPPLIKDLGKDSRTIMYADYGVNVLGDGIVVNNDFMKEKPDVLRRFMRGVNKSWDFAQKNPDEVVDIGLKHNTAAKRDGFKAQLVNTFPLLHSDHSKGKPLGWMAEEDWKTSVALLEKYSGLPAGSKPLSTYYTNDFIPQ